jgi:hypothetical protein
MMITKKGGYIPIFLFIAEAVEDRDEGAQPCQRPALPPQEVSMQLKREFVLRLYNKNCILIQLDRPKKLHDVNVKF